MEMEFRSASELYERLKPALITKAEEMRRNGYEYIKEEDVWNYLKEVKWIKTVNLELYQMVEDVLNSDDATIDTYLKEKLNLKNRRVYFEES